MNLPMLLSDRLSIDDICALHAPESKNFPVIIRFTFFGEECTMVLDARDIEREWISFTSTEAPSDLSDSFESVLEDFWKEIKQQYLEYRTEEGDEEA